MVKALLSNTRPALLFTFLNSIETLGGVCAIEKQVFFCVFSSKTIEDDKLNRVVFVIMSLDKSGPVLIVAPDVAIMSLLHPHPLALILNFSKSLARTEYWKLDVTHQVSMWLVNLAPPPSISTCTCVLYFCFLFHSHTCLWMLWSGSNHQERFRSVSNLLTRPSRD